MNMEHRFEVAPTDAWVAFELEAERADKDQMYNTGKRQRDTGLHIRNATRHLAALAPPGTRVKVEIVFSIVPAVIPALNRDAPLRWVENES